MQIGPYWLLVVIRGTARSGSMGEALEAFDAASAHVSTRAQVPG